MGKIIVLDEHTTNLIAAGEVIERACSVAKELVENSIDAGASRIEISLQESGIKEIVVTDNGCGMSMEDARLCVMPHATSKILNEKDLFRITTLGFRGEALASIVAVSNFMLKTSNDGNKGIMYSLSAGKITSEAIIAQPKGCEIKVKNLFFNTPARLQNLKAPNVELSFITDFISKIALANPNIAFKLSNNNNVIFQTYGNNEILETISAVYGVEVAKKMMSFDDSDGYFTVSGYTSRPEVTKANKNQITLVINGRVVKNSNLTNAIIDSYGDRLMIGRYPITIMDIKCDYGLIDVNVHPSKTEVRFSNEEGLITLINNAITYAIKNSDYIVGATNKEEKEEAFEEDYAVLTENEIGEDGNISEDAWEEPYDEVPLNEEVPDEEISFNVDNNIPLEEKDDNYDVFFKESVPVKQTHEKEEVKEKPYKEFFAEQSFSFREDSPIETKEEKSKLPKLYYVGQIFGTYILTQNEEGLFLLDQHAVAERINYEKIKANLSKSDTVTYELIVPIKLNYALSEAILVREKLDEFKKFGLEIEEFGSGFFLVRVIPTWIFKGREKEFVEEIINNVIHQKKLSKEEFLDSMAKSMACKKSIKANHYLPTSQVEFLLEELQRCDNPYNCPHGRPTIVKFTKEEIEKWFKRIV